jgi:type II secretory pathway pseudopilin PulG
MIARRARKKVLAFSLQPSAFACAGFTMVEIAISLAIIGFALVAILGALPIGMRMQRDNREQTVINQDATVLLEAIRGGARGANDLTNYVYAITNYWTQINPNRSPASSGANGYTYGSVSITSPALANYFSAPINNGANIIGLLSTPEFMDLNGGPLNNQSFDNGGFSNHIVAYVRSISGPAVEKPPQANESIVREDSFTYRILCVNAPVEMPPPAWQSSRQYNAGSQVSLGNFYWQATITTTAQPGPPSTDWVKLSYLNQLAANIHELRLMFLWPQLPNGGLGLGRQTFRTLIAGQLIFTPNNLYFYQSQSFTNAP